MSRPPLRVAVLGAGTVGREVIARVAAHGGPRRMILAGAPETMQATRCPVAG